MDTQRLIRHKVQCTDRPQENGIITFYNPDNGDIDITYNEKGARFNIQKSNNRPMKRKLILSPFAELAIAMILLSIIGLSIRSCGNRNKEQSHLNEMLEYHSKECYLVVESDGYTQKIKQ